jgi:outer membrane protein assembly factor BamA
MRPVLLLLVLFCITAQTVSGQFPVIRHDTIVIVENTLKKVSKNVSFTVIPGPESGTTQKVGFVVLPMLVYSLKRSDTISPPSSSAVMFYFDFYGSWATAVKQSLYWNQNKWRAFVSFGIGDMRLKYFGVGRDTNIINNDDSNYVWTHQKGIALNMSCFRKIYRGLYGGLEFRYSLTDLNGTDSLSEAMLVEDGLPLDQVSENVVIPSFIWDNRDNIYWSTKGYYSAISFQFANSFLFKSSNYSILSGWVNGYHSLLPGSRRLILAWHGYFMKGWGTLPYLRYASYGQGDDVTGYTRGKYMNKSEVSVQTELRYELWKFISCGGYLGTGKIFPDISVFGQSVWLHYGGVRLYFNIIPSRNIRLRLDGAIARKDWGFYIGIGQGF